MMTISLALIRKIQNEKTKKKEEQQQHQIKQNKTGKHVIE